MSRHGNPPKWRIKLRRPNFRTLSAAAVAGALLIGGSTAAIADDTPSDSSTTVVEQVQSTDVSTETTSEEQSSESTASDQDVAEQKTDESTPKVDQPSSKPVAEEQSSKPADKKASTKERAPPVTSSTSSPKKVFVCKYVGKPGVDERLKGGKNPISVSVNAIPDYQGVGSYFADARGRSYVLAKDKGQETPSVNECPEPDSGTTTEPSTPKVSIGQCVDGNRAVTVTGSVYKTTTEQGKTPVIFANGSEQVDTDLLDTTKGDVEYTLTGNFAPALYEDFVFKYSNNLIDGFKEIKLGPVTVSPCDTPPPPCVTLSSDNVDDYAVEANWSRLSSTVTLKEVAGGYCNDWQWSHVGHTYDNPPSSWPQTVAVVATGTVGKSGLSDTVTVIDFCGQFDGYEGPGPKVGDKLNGPGQGYEADHRFFSDIFGGPASYDVDNPAKCKETPPVVVKVPGAPETIDPCNPVGVTDNVAWKDALSEDTDQVDWSESSDGRTRIVAPKGNAVWEDGTTAPKEFTLPKDSGVVCEIPPTEQDDTYGSFGICTFDDGSGVPNGGAYVYGENPADEEVGTTRSLKVEFLSNIDEVLETRNASMPDDGYFEEFFGGYAAGEYRVRITDTATGKVVYDEPVIVDVCVVEPPKTGVIKKSLFEEDKTCKGLSSRKGSVSVSYSVDPYTGETTYGEPVVTWGKWTKVRDLTNAEKVELKCITTTPPAGSHNGGGNTPPKLPPLAQTGFEGSYLVLGGLGAALVGGILVFFAYHGRRKSDTESADGVGQIFPEIA